MHIKMWFRIYELYILCGKNVNEWNERKKKERERDQKNGCEFVKV